MFLMLRDDPVMYFDFDEMVVQVLDRERMPFSLRAGIKDNVCSLKEMLKNVQLLKTWFSRRVLSLSRTNAKQIYAMFQMQQLDDVESRSEFCIRCLGVSIQDSYWIKQDDSDLRFEKVNIRHQHFKDIVDVALYGDSPTVTENGLCPDLTTHGVFRKAWVREEDGLYLLKSDLHENNINTRMEVLASKVLGCMDGEIEYVNYCGEVQNTAVGNLYVDKCKNFVDDEYSFVEAWEVEEYCKWNGVDFKEYFVGFHGAASIGVIDYIIMNTDRHMQNYGFKMANDSGQIVGMAPLFDFNCALVADAFGKNAEDTLSQMFNDGSTIRQVAEQYRGHCKLHLDGDKFDRLMENHKEYESILHNVKERCSIMGVL